MNSRNRGAGRFGRLLNSGCACVPTQNGWPVSSTNSTSRPSGDEPERAQPAALELAAVPRVELVAVAVPLGHDGLLVRLGDDRTRLELGDVRAEPHRAAHVGHVALSLHQVDHRVRRRRVELGRVRAGEPEHVAGVVDHHHLQTEAQAEARDAVLAGVARGGDLALGSALAEAARDHDAIEVVQASRDEQALDLLGLDPLDLDVGAVVEAAVLERLGDRQVRVGKADVLADDADAHLARRRLDPLDEALPLHEVGSASGSPRWRTTTSSKPSSCSTSGISYRLRASAALTTASIGTSHRLEIFFLSASEIARSLRHTMTSGWMPRDAQLGHRVLRGLGLLLTRRSDERHQRDVHVADVVATDVEAELPDRLEERKDLDVAHRAADLGDDDVDVVTSEARDAALDLVGDVRDHLHGLAEVVAAALRGEHRGVDRAGGRVRVARQRSRR